MERESKDVTLLPSLFKGPWDIVKLGRWAGSFVLISALVLAAWEAFGLEIPAGQFSWRIRIFWRTLVQLGSWGVIIILLAELVDRVYGGQDSDDEEALR